MSSFLILASIVLFFEKKTIMYHGLHFLDRKPLKSQFLGMTLLRDQQQQNNEHNPLSDFSYFLSFIAFHWRVKEPNKQLL